MDIVERLLNMSHAYYYHEHQAMRKEAADEIERLREALRYYACDCKINCRDNRMNKCGYEATEALGEKE